MWLVLGIVCVGDLVVGEGGVDGGVFRGVWVGV